MDQPIKKTVGIFCHDLPIYKDPIGQYGSTTLTNELFSRYFDVVDELIVATRVYEINKKCEEAHQEVITLPNIRFLDLPNLNNAKALFGTIRYVKKILSNEIKNVDLIFIRAGMIANIAAGIARKYKKPYLLECGWRAFDAYWHHSFIGKLIAPYMEYKTRRDIKKAAVVIFVTNNWLQQCYPTEGLSFSVSDVVLSEQSDSILSNRINHIKSKKLSDEIVLGTTGGIDVKYKGQQFVINAIGKIKNDVRVRYEIVGGGDSAYLKNIAEQAGISNNVCFKGQLKHNEVLEWLDNIDLYIQPSMLEGLPRAMLESMSRACPVIGSNVGGIPELLDGANMFQVGSIDEIAWFIKNFYNLPLIQMAEKNYKIASAYTGVVLNQRRKDVFNIYKELVKKSGENSK